MTRGVVIGRFLPFHRGHMLVIQRAIDECDQVTVIICNNDTQPIPAYLRASWVMRVFPTVEVIITDAYHADDDSESWAKDTLRWLSEKPDKAYSSENYEHWASLIGAEHVMVDHERKTVPISGTAIRVNPLLHLHYLHPVVQDYYLMQEYERSKVR